MPIYAYRCASCGHARDVLQKMSDPVLTICPACGAESFSKQLTAAGFQLKGSGWYTTDFRNGSGGGASAGKSATGGSGGESAAPAPASEAPASGGSGGASSAAASTAPSTAPSTGGCAGSCACH